MSSIVERKRKDGTKTYLARVIIMRDRQIIHNESRTFENRMMAKAWVEKREAEVRAPGFVDTREPKLSAAIDRYIETSLKQIGKTKAQVLRTIKNECAIADLRCSQIGATDIVAFAQELTRRGIQPSTVKNYTSHLGAVFAVAKVAFDMPLDPRAMTDAYPAMKRLGIIGNSLHRDRRPTIEEMTRLIALFRDKTARRRNTMPMAEIAIFALLSTRRQDEILRLRWGDLEPGRVLVRDMKHPGDKMGNDVWCELPEEAERIIARMPRVKPEIFPFGTDAVSANFTRACKLLGIEDLHFHDLRHEGISRLFEMGRTIPQVASVSGHRSWTSLKRYTHLRHTGDKWAEWLKHLALPPIKRQAL